MSFNFLYNTFIAFFFILLINLKLKNLTSFIVFGLYDINLKILFTIKQSIFYFCNSSKDFLKIVIISFLRNFLNSFLFSIFLLIKKILLILI